MEDAWKFVWDKLFCKESNLIYDYLSDREHEARFEHLPKPEETAAQVPNPCGWGTGMEDCMLNSGSVIDTLRLRQELLAEDNTMLAEQMVDGIFLCATVHGREGFLVRGVAPDRKTCYPESSRDQFTLAVFGLWRFLHTWPDASERARRQAKQIIVSVARFCEKMVTPENGYDLRRLDGCPALCSKMWECEVHEWLRLPMIYAAAFDCSGDLHWREMTARYADRALAESQKFDPNSSAWWDISLMQMQISLTMFRELNLFSEMESALTALTHRVASKSEEKLRETLSEAIAYQGKWTVLNTNWRFGKFSLQPQVPILTGGLAVFGGKTYLNPCFSGEFLNVWKFLRGTGNYLIACALDSAWEMPEDIFSMLSILIERQEFAECATDGVINLLHGYWLVQENQKGKRKCCKMKMERNVVGMEEVYR